MKKTSKKTKIISVLAAVLLLALFVSGTLVVALYNTVLKPADFTFTAPATGDGSGYYRHCYEELSEEEKKVYSVVLESIYEMPERIEIPEIGAGNLNKIFTAISHDNPDLFCLGLNCTVYKEGLKTYFKPTYSLTSEEYKTQLEEAKGIASVIINNAGAFTSTYEKELYVHDYLVTHCSYADPDTNPSANTMYGCLVEGKASCEGYSRTFQYIMSALNIDNRLVTGESAEDGVNYIGHMWNYVVIDGESYFVDVTWDDPKTATSVLRHTYFNVTTNDILLQHRNIEQTVPLCTSTKYNYFVYENALGSVSSGEQFDTFVENAVYNALQRGYKCIELRFPDSVLLEQAKNTLFNTGVIYTIYNDAGLLKDLEGAKVYYSTEEDMNVLCLFF